MMTQLEKRLSETAIALLEDSSALLFQQAGMLAVLAERMPGLTPDEKTLFLRQSESDVAQSKTRQADAARLKAELPKLQSPEYPLS